IAKLGQPDREVHGDGRFSHSALAAADSNHLLHTLNGHFGHLSGLIWTHFFYPSALAFPGRLRSDERMRTTAFTIALALLAGITASAADYFVYIGTYTNTGKSKGIYLFRLDSTSGKLTPVGLAAEISTPPFVATHPTGRYLYSVTE